MSVPKRKKNSILFHSRVPPTQQLFFLDEHALDFLTLTLFHLFAPSFAKRNRALALASQERVDALTSPNPPPPLLFPLPRNTPLDLGHRPRLRVAYLAAHFRQVPP